MNLHNIEITVYNGVRDTNGYVLTLFKILNNVDYDAITSSSSTADTERRRQIKLSLPQAISSGVFAPTRSADNLIKHSDLICVDINRKANEQIANIDTLSRL